MVGAPAAIRITRAIENGSYALRSNKKMDAYRGP